MCWWAPPSAARWDSPSQSRSRPPRTTAFQLKCPGGLQGSDLATMIALMKRHPAHVAPLPRDRGALQTVADRALSRAAGAPLVAGHAPRGPRDGAEECPA